MSFVSGIIGKIMAKIVADLMAKIADPKLRRELAEKILDAAENYADKTEAKWDNTLIEVARKLLGMPDLPDD